ncbi:Prefoldin subunit-domain-containing protein [Schizophyllum commune]|nr:Prefoldin, subunit 4 [Schizophyllum commune H4-8]KAI5889276.1 Prefoldin, subunit 4 [Schizophyllum commune H4-8]
MQSMRMLDKQDENEEAEEVTWEDQQRINSFSKLNTRVRDLNEKLKELKVEKEALEDLSTELELADEDEPVLYKVGETFLHLPLPRAQKRLARDQADVEKRLAAAADSVDDCERQMKELKVVLYAKFGKAINLDE